MENLLKKETSRKSRIRIKRKLNRIQDNSESSENAIDSLENSTENTGKRLLPNRPGRGNMMKLLQEKEPDEEDEFYNLLFAEKSSDEEFNPSNTELSEDSINSEEGEEGIENPEKANEENKDSELEEAIESSVEEENIIIESKPRPKIKLKKTDNRAREPNRRRGKKEKDDIVDIDLLDIDKIDEIEEMRDKGIYKEEMSSDEFDDEDEESSTKRKKRKAISKKNHTKKKNKSNLILLDTDEQYTKKSYRKAFIDDEEEEPTLMKKRHRPTIVNKLKNKNLKKKKIHLQVNPNVKFNKKDPDTLIISKAIFDDENLTDSQEEKEEDILEYNDEFIKDQENRNIQFEEENKKIIKKFKKPEKQEGTTVKYNFMQEKLSQKDLLIEAIFTEYYNIQSLQEMQRLEDLNKKELPTQGRREFSEYVRIVKRVPSLEDKSKLEPEKIEEENLTKVESYTNIEEKKLKEDQEKEMIEKNELQNKKEELEKGNIITLPEENKENLITDDDVTIKDTAQQFPPSVKKENKIINNNHDQYVTFSNPIIYEKIFENFNKKSDAKEKKTCAVTGLSAKYFDPLTKQYYCNIESFKILRERYFQKEEDSLLFRIQTLSDFASQKKEKIKKFILSNENATNETSKNLLNMVNRYGILRNEPDYFDKKVISHRIYNRNRENCVESGMLKEANKERLVISKKIFRDKYSNRGTIAE